VELAAQVQPDVREEAGPRIGKLDGVIVGYARVEWDDTESGERFYDGVLARDYPLIIGIILVVSVAVVLVNLITDVVYAIVDPRIRYD
jgi:ABC-type antimicrobial peptide transport system permease subunit